jgi:hypothetical protein
VGAKHASKHEIFGKGFILFLYCKDVVKYDRIYPKLELNITKYYFVQIILYSK